MDTKGLFVELFVNYKEGIETSFLQAYLNDASADLIATEVAEFVPGTGDRGILRLTCPTTWISLYAGGEFGITREELVESMTAEGNESALAAIKELFDLGLIEAVPESKPLRFRFVMSFYSLA